VSRRGRAVSRQTRSRCQQLLRGLTPALTAPQNLLCRYPCRDANQLQFYSIGGAVRTTWIFKASNNAGNLVARPGAAEPQVTIQVGAWRRWRAALRQPAGRRRAAPPQLLCSGFTCRQQPALSATLPPSSLPPPPCSSWPAWRRRAAAPPAASCRPPAPGTATTTAPSSAPAGVGSWSPRRAWRASPRCTASSTSEWR
jgi:hypothetical protein